MRTLCYYVSDYGAGHATRSIALIRALLSSYPSLRIIVKSDGPFAFLARSLCDPRVTVMRYRNDISIPLIPSIEAVDIDATESLLCEWHETWDSYIAREVQFCREEGVSLILSDIAPQPFLVADDVGVPSIAISNFSWDAIYEHLLPGRSGCVSDMRSAYSRASLACILPFHIPMTAFKKSVSVSLLVRAVTVPRQQMRERLGFSEEDRVIFFNPRCPPDQLKPDFFRELARERSIRIVMPSAYAADHPHIIPLPPDETESQNWIGMCEGVVTRCGYSTVSEAVQAHVPLIVWERPGFCEDMAIASTIRRLGIGMALEYRQIRSLDWILSLQKIPLYKQHYERTGTEYTNNGSEEILTHLKEFIL